MASIPVTRAWTIPASGGASLKSIINNDDVVWVTYVTVRSDINNSGNVTWSDKQGGQTGGYMIPGEAVLLGDDIGATITDYFYFNGTAGDTVYFTIGISLGNTLLG